MAADATTVDYGITMAKIIGVNISTCLKFSFRLFLVMVHLNPLEITRIDEDHPRLTTNIGIGVNRCQWGPESELCEWGITRKICCIL